MGTCPSCGGVLGRDCFNPEECATIASCSAAQALEIFGELRAERDQLRQQVGRLVGPAREVEKAHRSVIEAVTPGHPNSILGPGPHNKEEYDARFSRWHAASRSLRVALEDFDSAADQVRKELGE